MNVIGIDLGVHKIAMALFIANELADVISWEAPYDLPRDRQLRELAGVAYDWGLGHDADMVWVEEPLMGNNHKYSMAIAELKGAVLSHLNALRSRGCDIRTVNVSSWKREVVGKGNASKEQVSNYIVATHPDYAALCDGDQDRIDAACIGLYGLRITARAEGLRLAEPSQ